VVGARLVAVVVALGLVLGGLAVRQYRSGEDLSLPSLGGSDRVVNLVCIQELATVCQGLETETLKVTIEAAGVTADRLSGADASVQSTGIDGWIAPVSWIEMVRQKRARAGAPPLLGTAGPVIARTPIIVVTDNARITAISSKCKEGALGQPGPERPGDDVAKSGVQGVTSWRCIGDVMGSGRWARLVAQTGSGWGDIKVGWDNPGTSATGLATLGSFTTGYFGRSDIDALSIDDDASGYGQWITSATSSLASVNNSANALSSLLAAGPAAFDFVVIGEAASTTLLNGAARRNSVVALYPTPTTTIDLALATLGENKKLKELVEAKQMKKTLRDAGWRAGSDSPPQGVKADLVLPKTDGLPPAGISEKLRGKWQQELGR